MVLGWAMIVPMENIKFRISKMLKYVKLEKTSTNGWIQGSLWNALAQLGPNQNLMRILYQKLTNNFSKKLKMMENMVLVLRCLVLRICLESGTRHPS